MYRAPSVSNAPAIPHTALCSCDQPLLYEAAPETAAPVLE